MHAEVYANRRASAQTEQVSSLKTADNYLNLLPEHRNEINSQWLSHIAKQRISGNGFRILTAIYRHTIGFNKQKDDLSGKRLQQISSIRADHANHTLRVLAADHVLICQDGRYGQIVSINFDFASWGKKHCKDNQITPKFISDPRTLLPEYYRDEPIDTGNIIGANLSDVLEENTYLPDVTTDNTHTTTTADKTADKTAKTEAQAPQYNPETAKNHTEKIEKDDSETLIVVKKSSQIIEKLVKKLDHLEDHIQTLQQQISDIEHIQSQPQDAINTSTIEKKSTATDTQATEEQAIPRQAFNTIDTNASEAQQTQTPAINTNAVDNSTTAMEDSLSTSPELIDLRYPDNIDQHSRHALQGLLFKAKGHAQNILDLLALRLENTQNPIQDIVVYCSSLVRLAHKNALDLDTLHAYRAKQKPALSIQEQQMQKLQQEYQEAYTEYQHFKHINELQAQSRQCSIEKYLDESGMQGFWDGIVTRLEQVKAEIEQLKQ